MAASSYPWWGSESVELVMESALAALNEPEVLRLHMLPDWKSNTLSSCQTIRRETSDPSFQLPQKWTEGRISQVGGAGSLTRGHRLLQLPGGTTEGELVTRKPSAEPAAGREPVQS